MILIQLETSSGDFYGDGHHIDIVESSFDSYPILFLKSMTFVPLQSTYFKPKKEGDETVPDNRIPLNMYPLASPNIRQITFVFTLYYKSDNIWVNCIIVIFIFI